MIKIHLLLLIFINLVTSCRSPGDSMSEPRFTDVDYSTITGREFDELTFELDEAYLGSFSSDKPKNNFVPAPLFEIFKNEMALSFEGRSHHVRFLHCEARNFLPSTTDSKQCDYVLRDRVAQYEFSFRAFDRHTAESCMLIEEDCMIYQVVKIRSAQDGMQRPPVFVSKTPLSKKVLLKTNRVFYPAESSFLDYFKRWTGSDEAFYFIMNPYSFDREYGSKLASLLGECSRSYVNIINFSDAAIRTYQNRRKPVLVSHLAVKSILATAYIMIGAKSPGKLINTLGPLIKAGKFKSVQTVWAGKNFITDFALLPAAVVTMSNWQEHLGRYEKGSPQRAVIETGILLAKFGETSGLIRLGILGLQHVKNTAKVLATLAVGGGAATVAIRTKGARELVRAMRAGDQTRILTTLCEMEKQVGVIRDCSPPPRTPDICSK